MSNFSKVSETEGKGLINTESLKEKITLFSIFSEPLLCQGKTVCSEILTLQKALTLSFRKEKAVLGSKS